MTIGTQAFSAEILEQSRSLLVLPVLIVLGGLMVGNLLGWFLRAQGASAGISGAVVVAFFGLGIGMAIWNGQRPQGSVRLEGRQIVVDPRGRSAGRFEPAVVEARVWRRQMPARLSVGAIVRVGTPGRNITIGAADPSLANRFETHGLEETAVPPSVTIDARRFEELLQHLSGHDLTEPS